MRSITRDTWICASSNSWKQSQELQTKPWQGRLKSILEEILVSQVSLVSSMERHQRARENLAVPRVKLPLLSRVRFHGQKIRWFRRRNQKYLLSLESLTILTLLIFRLGKRSNMLWLILRNSKTSLQEFQTLVILGKHLKNNEQPWVLVTIPTMKSKMIR